MNRPAKGFTLIEVMIVVVLIGILTSVALPQYRQYVTRARLTEAISALSAVQTEAENFWPIKRTFVGFDRVPPNTANFDFTLDSATASAFKVVATGKDGAAGFVYTIDERGTRATTAAPPDYLPLSSTCWIDTKGGKCTQ